MGSLYLRRLCHCLCLQFPAFRTFVNINVWPVVCIQQPKSVFRVQGQGKHGNKFTLCSFLCSVNSTVITYFESCVMWPRHCNAGSALSSAPSVWFGLFLVTYTEQRGKQVEAHASARLTQNLVLQLLPAGWCRGVG